MAAATYKKDLYRSTNFTLGARETDDTTAIITGIVDGITDARSQLEVAAIVAETARGPFHPDDSNLPLKRVRAFAIGPNTAQVVLEYQHDASSRNAGSDAFLVATLSPGVVAETQYVFTGTRMRDTGDDGVKDLVVYDFIPKVRHVPVEEVAVSVRTATSPHSTLKDKISKTNSAAVSFSGASHGTHTVRYDGHHVRADVLNGTTSYECKYFFTFKESGWLRELPSTAGTAAVVELMYEGVSFTGFPTS